MIATSITSPGTILIGINDRDPQNHDVYRHNLKTGEQALLFRNDDGYSSFVADDSLAIRMVAKQTPAGGLDVFRRDSAGNLTRFTRISPEDALTTQLIGFDVAGTTLYALDSRGRDTAALVTLDLEGGAAEVLAQSDKADVNDTLAHPATGKVQAAQVEYLREEWQPIDPAIKSDIEFLNANARGEWKVTSRSRDDKWWTVRVDRVTEPVAFWLYDRGAKRFTKLFTARPNLEGAPLSPMYPVEIKARDGLTLVSYLHCRAARTRTAAAGPRRRCRWCSTFTAGHGIETPSATNRHINGWRIAATPCSQSTTAARPASERNRQHRRHAIRRHDA